MSPDPNPDSNPRQLTARGRDRRQALLDFATTRFALNGFHPTSVSDIVDGIGVGKGVFYWYFPSKDDLLLEILREALRSLRVRQGDAIRDTANPLQRLESAVRTSLEWSAENRDVLRLVMFGWTEERFATALQRGRRITIADTARHVRDAMNQGLIAPGDPELLAGAIVGITEELSRQAAGDGTHVSQTLSDNAVRMCLFGVVGNR